MTPRQIDENIYLEDNVYYYTKHLHIPLWHYCNNDLTEIRSNRCMKCSKLVNEQKLLRLASLIKAIL